MQGNRATMKKEKKKVPLLRVVLDSSTGTLITGYFVTHNFAQEDPNP